MIAKIGTRKTVRATKTDTKTVMLISRGKRVKARTLSKVNEFVRSRRTDSCHTKTQSANVSGGNANIARNAMHGEGSQFMCVLAPLFAAWRFLVHDHNHR